MSSYYQMQIQKKKQEEAAEKLSSGSQINSAGDDAAGLAISEKMRNQITIAEVSSKNAADAQNMVKTAEGAMSSIHDMLNRTTELAATSANGIYSDTERAMIQTEVDAIASEINRVAASTNFNGINLLDGTLSEGADMQVGTDGSTISIAIDNVAGASQIDTSSLTVQTQEDAAAILAALEDFVNNLSTQRAELGAKDNALSSTQRQLDFMKETMQSTESQIRDTDMAKEASEESKHSTLLKSTQSMLAKANEEKKGILNLFA